MVSLVPSRSVPTVHAGPEASDAIGGEEALAEQEGLAAFRQRLLEGMRQVAAVRSRHRLPHRCTSTAPGVRHSVKFPPEGQAGPGTFSSRRQGGRGPDRVSVQSCSCLETRN